MFAHAVQGSTVVVWQLGTPTISDAREEIEVVRGVVDAQGKASLLIVIENAKGAPSAEVRRTYREAADGKGRVSAVALVILQRGLAGKMIRTMAKAILTLVARSKPVRMFGDVAEAAEWVSAKSGDSARDLEQTARDLEAKL